MKRLLIISPYFPPVNAPDMQRVRISLGYYREYGWEPEVVAVDPAFTDINRDDLLMVTIPGEIKVHYVKAFPKKYTSKVGLGSIALRSLYFYRKVVNRLLEQSRFDLIFFSTTQFPICVLGAYWKRRYKVPYVIDMQDPWHSEYYKDKNKQERPPKYWFSYRLNKLLEPKAIRSVDGLISVSEQYILDLKDRYSAIKQVPSVVIPFGALDSDMLIAAAKVPVSDTETEDEQLNVVYVGRGGSDMHKALEPLFEAVKDGLIKRPDLYRKFHFNFIGTSYAPHGQGKPTIAPLAAKYGLDGCVTEITERVSYFQALATLLRATALFIPGSDDPKYSASKLFPYLLTGKPLLAIFNKNSPALSLLYEFGASYVYDYQTVELSAICNFLEGLATGELKATPYSQYAVEKYSAEYLTGKQCDLFNIVIDVKS